MGCSNSTAKQPTSKPSQPSPNTHTTKFNKLPPLNGEQNLLDQRKTKSVRVIKKGLKPSKNGLIEGNRASDGEILMEKESMQDVVIPTHRNDDVEIKEDEKDEYKRVGKKNENEVKI